MVASLRVGSEIGKACIEDLESDMEFSGELADGH